MVGSDYLNNWFLTLQLRIIMKSNLRISFHEYLSRKSRHTVGNSKVRGEQQCRAIHIFFRHCEGMDCARCERMIHISTPLLDAFIDNELTMKLSQR